MLRLLRLLRVLHLFRMLRLLRLLRMPQHVLRLCCAQIPHWKAIKPLRNKRNTIFRATHIQHAQHTLPMSMCNQTDHRFGA